MKIKKIISLMLSAVMIVGITACGEQEETVKKAILPDREEFVGLTEWNEAMMQAYLRPYWNTREIYNETIVFIGEEGEATLMFMPDEIESVKNFGLTEIYKEGRDYTINGNKIKRVKGGKTPYWELDDYYLKEPNNPQAVISVNPAQCAYSFEETRYLRYGEQTVFTSKQLAVTYRHSDAFDGKMPQGQTEKFETIKEKLNGKEKIKVTVYGDSVGVGCNASGTIYGGNTKPYMPDGYEMFCKYLERIYGSEVEYSNQATGGWKVENCIQNYDSRIKDRNIDLLILRIGGNDQNSNKDKFVMEVTILINRFFNDHPDACLLILTPQDCNNESTWVVNGKQVERWIHSAVQDCDRKDRIGIADAFSFVEWMRGKGKKDCDWLANNINHPNDFIIRLYTQLLLTTLLGDDFTEVIYE